MLKIIIFPCFSENVPNYHILTPTEQDGQQTGNYGKLISFDPNVPGYAPESKL
ncbi:unnamed protein product [Meloidogyne enterolobii]|uniref:Uncharacterized protein n=1 Tax=Meloidogyne enterolobii TaxID=390850 RepID=A0ACB1B6U9_MELEN